MVLKIVGKLEKNKSLPDDLCSPYLQDVKFLMTFSMTFNYVVVCVVTQLDMFEPT